MQQKKENDNIMNYDTVRLDDENNAIIIIDQTKLPGSIELIALKTAEEIWDAIYLLRVRGAPAIGVAAAFGIYLLAKQGSASDYDTFHEEFVKQKEYLDSARPTAVNLSWALNRMQGVLEAHAGEDVSKIKEYLKAEAVRSDVSETGRRHPDTLQCRSACHQQIWHSDSTDLSWRGKGISL